MKRQLAILTDSSGADFSPCRTWRYALWRIWDDRRQKVAFVGLNPSTADETANDPTIRRCIDFAKRWDFGGLYMLNIFAYRATQPTDMKRAADPIGPGNNEALAYYRTRVQLIVGAWGNHGLFQDRSEAVKGVLARRIDCLKVTSQGQPSHPLYLPAVLRPQLWWSPEP